MRSLDDTEKVDCNLMLCYRGWDDPTNYYNQKFNTIFIDPVDYYEHNGNIENYFTGYLSDNLTNDPTRKSYQEDQLKKIAPLMEQILDQIKIDREN
jgi:hypothetical protein